MFNFIIRKGRVEVQEIASQTFHHVSFRKIVQSRYQFDTVFVRFDSNQTTKGNTIQFP